MFCKLAIYYVIYLIMVTSCLFSSTLLIHVAHTIVVINIGNETNKLIEMEYDLNFVWQAVQVQNYLYTLFSK